MRTAGVEIDNVMCVSTNGGSVQVPSNAPVVEYGWGSPGWRQVRALFRHYQRLSCLGKHSVFPASAMFRVLNLCCRHPPVQLRDHDDRYWVTRGGKDVEEKRSQPTWPEFGKQCRREGGELASLHSRDDTERAAAACRQAGEDACFIGPQARTDPGFRRRCKSMRAVLMSTPGRITPRAPKPTVRW